ncbi:MAG: glycosyl transferase family 1 [unclassified Hahellaceae]|nr:glycosyl transferase family 1 [Hahellaceae bacterium]|tara:strand:+ start:54109 stop:55335 length:1227 start_codon:yes stop_codon:yes gene_type:complete
MKICFLVGSIAISGGTYVILQHASFLKKAGHDVTLAIQEAFDDSTRAWHDEALELECVPIEAAKSSSFDLVIATWWKTVFELHNFSATHYAYFVQSIETKFYPEEEKPLRELVESTYKFPLSYATEATWIREYLAAEHGHTAALIKNGIRKDIYHPRSPGRNGIALKQPRILVEGHFGVRFKNTALAVKLAREAGAQDIWVLTGTPIPFKWLPNVRKVFSRVHMAKTADIYRSCDVLIKLSTVEGMFGPPLEMFHCGGTAVVFDVTGHDEYIVDGDNARVVRTGDLEGAVAAIRQLISEPSILKQLKEGALKTAAEWPSWESASAQFAEWVLKVSSGPMVDRAVFEEATKASFQKYEAEERLRLEIKVRTMPRHKISQMAARLPPGLFRIFKGIEAVMEIISPAKKVY